MTPDSPESATPVALETVDADPVAQWLISQENTATRLKPTPAARIAHKESGPDAVEAFLDQLDPVMLAKRDNAAEWIAEEAEESFAVKETASAYTPLEASVDRVRTEVDNLYDAFKFLEQQLGGMEELCEQLAQAR